MSDAPLRWHHRPYVWLQYLLPQHLLSALIYRLTRLRWRPFKNLLVRSFVWVFRVDTSEAACPEPTAYESFNAFFTRALRPDARPMPKHAGTLICPADGILSQFGPIVDGRIFQAKGLDYSLLELLGGELDWEELFARGRFATIYLAPRDYHRVHMPLAGRLREMLHIPGRLFSVNRITTHLVPRLFARNERVVCLFDTAAGPMAMILVGAIFVGSIDTVWAGQVVPSHRRTHRRAYGRHNRVELAKGDEMGRFNMGSTVILLFPPGAVVWESTVSAGSQVRVGQRLGRTSDTY